METWGSVTTAFGSRTSALRTDDGMARSAGIFPPKLGQKTKNWDRKKKLSVEFKRRIVCELFRSTCTACSARNRTLFDSENNLSRDELLCTKKHRNN